VLRDSILPALRISAHEFADRLQVSRNRVRALLQERRDLSPDMAVRLARLLGHSAERWMRRQLALDLWRIAQDPARVAGIEPLPRSVVDD
jgi:addiction module HigA family antidote